MLGSVNQFFTLKIDSTFFTKTPGIFWSVGLRHYFLHEKKRKVALDTKISGDEQSDIASSMLLLNLIHKA